VARTVIFALGLLLVMIAPASVAAGQPDRVDPSLMQPALNPTFAPWDCWRRGTGIICDGQRSDSWTNEVTFLECDGRPVYSTGTDVRTLRRNGDANGLGLWSKSHVMIDEVLTMQPDGSGPAITAFGRFEQRFEYGVPGDLATRTERYAGIDVHVTAPGLGVILHDTGVKTFDIDDNVILAHGPHPLLEDFDAAFAKVCDAFAELGA
jgi:hypothetical protein